MSIVSRVAMGMVWLAVSACGTPLRSPVCRQGEFSLPSGAVGRYHVTSFTADPRYSGAMTGMSDVEFSISEQPGGYALAVGRAPSGHLGRSAGGARQSRLARAVGVDETLGGLLPLAICKVGDGYFAQSLGDDGTYTLSRFDLSPTGITATPLFFKPDELARAGFRMLFVPAFAGVDLTGATPSWSFSTSTGGQTRTIVDNAGMAEGARERLIALAHPSSGGLVYSRLGPASGPSPGERVYRLPRGEAP